MEDPSPIHAYSMWIHPTARLFLPPVVYTVWPSVFLGPKVHEFSGSLTLVATRDLLNRDLSGARQGFGDACNLVGGAMSGGTEL